MTVSGKETERSVRVMPEVRRVMVYRLGSLGDTVVALPALHLVAKAFPRAEKRMLTNVPVHAKAPAAAAILASTGLMESYERYEVGLRSPLKLMGLLWRIWRWRPEVLVYLASGRGVEVARRDARFFKLCGVKRIVGLPLTEAMQVPARDANGVYEFEAERLARNVVELGDARLEDPASWELRLTPLEREKASAVLAAVGERPVFAVSVGTKVQSKDWGRENWRALLGRMGERYPGYALALLGAKEETEASGFAAEGWVAAGGGPVVSLCGSLTPRESAAVMERCRLFVGHDSGPMHLATAVGTRCVAIFAARNKPKVWFPYGDAHRVVYHKVDCWGCGLETCIVEGKKCLLSIGVDEVMGAVGESIREQGTGVREQRAF